MPFENLPYVNFHELNADWMIEQLGNLNQYTESAQQAAEDAAESAATAQQSIADAQGYAEQAAGYVQDASDQADRAEHAADDLAEEIADLEADVATVMNSAINPYAGRTLHAFGDSNMVTSYITPKIYSLVANALNMDTAYCHAENGAAFQPSNDTQIINEMDELPNDPDCGLVLCVGGINDLHYVTYSIPDFKQAVQDFITLAHGKYPYATIVMAFDSGSQMPNRKVLDYERAFMDVCQGMNMPGKLICIPTADMPLDTSLFYNTNHWSEAGINTMVSRICTMLNGGNPRLCTPRNIHTAYTQASPSEYGHYGIATNVLTEIDPYVMLRTDHVKVLLTASFGTTAETDQVQWLCTLPACYQYGDEHLVEQMRTVYGFWAQAPGGIIATGQMAFVYEPYSMEAVDSSPRIRLIFRYPMQVTNVSGRQTLLQFDLRTGYTPAD